MITKNACWILVKPEVLLFCRDVLESYLAERGFSVVCTREKTRLSDISVAIYKNSSTTVSALYRAFFNQIFGKNAESFEIWYLDYNEPISLIEAYEKLTKIKRDFRKFCWPQKLDILIEYNGEKMPYRYSYFHVSDADRETIERECELIEQWK
ncbi:MAG: hypothetical protein LBT55_06690 [Clostridiaceae bacterium]|jgi:hypothetical protein|nr:hypothetical protein [Clostridiaceae bacterium]